MTLVYPELIACHSCDLLHGMQEMPDGALASCQRCGTPLYRERKHPLAHGIALTLTALMLFAMSNFFPLLGLNFGGVEVHYTLLSGALELGRFAMWDVVTLVLLTSFLFPLLHDLTLLYVLIPLAFGRCPPHGRVVFKVALMLVPWGMVGVYMLGVLVAVVKLADMATVIPGVAVFSLGVLLFISVAAQNALEPRAIWRLMGKGA